MKPNRRFKHLILIPCLLLFAGYAFGDVYKWTDSYGKVHFSDKKPAGSDSEEIRLRENSVSVVERDTAEEAKPGEEETKSDGLKMVARPNVVIYTTEWCTYCNQAKAYFRAHQIYFTEYDVEKDASAARRFKQFGGRGVPVIFVGNRRINGFSVESFERAYYALD